MAAVVGVVVLLMSLSPVPDLSVSDLKAQLMEDIAEPTKVDSAEPEKAKRRGRGRPRKAVAANPTQAEITSECDRG